MFSKKAFNFDLDTKKLKSVFGNTRDGYKILKREFLSNGFAHRQWSGYVSQDKMTDNAAAQFVASLTNKEPWLAQCVKRFDITDIGKVYDMTAVIHNSAAIKNTGPAVYGTNVVSSSKQTMPGTYSPAFLEQMQGMKPRTSPGAVKQNVSDNVNE